MNFTQEVATQEQLSTDLAEAHRNRIFNFQSFTYRSCVEYDVEEKLTELPELVATMNAKIKAKDEFIKESYLSHQHPFYEDYLRQLERETKRTAVIEPFDFDSMRPSREVIRHINQQNLGGIDERTVSGSLTSRAKIRFLSYILSLDLKGDTTLSLEQIYHD